jgi:tripartite-type tricarboxylate transporter receptor subunit TctC
MMNLPRTFITLALALAAAAALAQSYPAKPVRIIAPYAPGGAVDLLAREIGNALTQNLHTTFIVDNRPGAGGNIGLTALAKAPADGYTLGMGAANMLAANRFLYRSLPFDTLKDFTPVAFVGRLPFVLVAHPKVRADGLKEMIGEMKARKASYSYGSSGVGNTAHIFGELLKNRADIDLVHVPYKSSGEALRDLIAGRLELQFITTVELAGPIQRGAVKPIAVAAPQRIAALPKVPTFAELDFHGFESPTWFGVIAPAGVPNHVLNLLNREIREALAKPQMKARLAQGGLEPQDMTPEQFNAFLNAEVKKWQAIVADSHVTLE